MNVDFRQKLEKNDRIKSILKKIKKNPPRVIIFEGGLKAQRLLFGKYWACCVNCIKEHGPCLECGTCSDIINARFPDVFILDGDESSIKIEFVREIIREKNIPPREGNYKLFLFNEAQNLTPNAANSLLKILEEPRDKNLFVLLSPQKTKLLPTIVSRSVVLTLKWERPKVEKDLYGTISSLMRFWETGVGLFKISEKKMESRQVEQIIIALQKILIDSVSDPQKDDGLNFFKKRPIPQQIWHISVILEQGLFMLKMNVSPKIVFEWMALNIYNILMNKSD